MQMESLAVIDTPFGNAEFREDLGKGIVVYEVGQNNYIYLSKQQSSLVPVQFRQEDGWYPESKQRILAIVFPSCFSPNCVHHAHRWLREEHYNLFEDIKGVLLLPTKLASADKHKERFFKINSSHFIETASWKDTSPNVPKGTVLVKASKGGDPWQEEAYFLIADCEYDKKRTEYGFVCVPGVHKERELV